MKLILCGSHISLMRRLEERDQPLFGRRTRRMIVEPFTYREMAHFLPHQDARDLLRAYGIFGGMPGHLDQLDPDGSLVENVARHLLDPSRLLYDEATHVLDGFGRSAALHYDVLFQIASGAHTWREIQSRVSRSGGAIAPVLDWLAEMEIVERDTPVTKPSPSRSKLSLYRVRDPYLGFWYRFIEPLYSAGAIGMARPEALWTRRIAPGLDGYIGGVFEEICRDFVRTRAPLPFEPYRIGRWWTRDGSHEIDLVVLGMDGELWVAECKWGSVGRADLQRLRDQSAALEAELGGVSRRHLAVFSGSGAMDRTVAAAVHRGEVSFFGPEALFAGPP